MEQNGNQQLLAEIAEEERQGEKFAREDEKKADAEGDEDEPVMAVVGEKSEDDN